MDKRQNPNKYAKNADIKPDSQLDTLKSLGSMLLLILGLVGLAMDLFKEDGLIKKIFAWVFASGSHMMVIPVVVGLFWLFDKMTSSPNASETKKAGNIPMYLMMAIGAFYLFKIITTGGF